MTLYHSNWTRRRPYTQPLPQSSCSQRSDTIVLAHHSGVRPSIFDFIRLNRLTRNNRLMTVPTRQISRNSNTHSSRTSKNMLECITLFDVDPGSRIVRGCSASVVDIVTDADGVASAMGRSCGPWAVDTRTGSFLFRLEQVRINIQNRCILICGVPQHADDLPKLHLLSPEAKIRTVPLYQGHFSEIQSTHQRLGVP